MTVVLGPAAGDTTLYGSRTSIASIPAIMLPLHARDPGCWVAGHLLNDNLGGSGVNPQNLTALTQTANKRHRGYEDKVKAACVRARQHHDRNRGESFWYGVRYTVTVSDETFGDFAPYDTAPSHITIEARVVRVDKVTNLIVDQLSGGKIMTNFGPVEIHNDDAHLHLV